jgi:hypothetical protein
MRQQTNIFTQIMTELREAAEKWRNSEEKDHETIDREIKLANAQGNVLNAQRKAFEIAIKLNGSPNDNINAYRVMGLLPIDEPKKLAAKKNGKAKKAKRKAA